MKDPSRLVRTWLEGSSGLKVICERPCRAPRSCRSSGNAVEESAQQGLDPARSQPGHRNFERGAPTEHRMRQVQKVERVTLRRSNDMLVVLTSIRPEAEPVVQGQVTERSCHAEAPSTDNTSARAHLEPISCVRRTIQRFPATLLLRLRRSTREATAALRPSLDGL